MDTGEFRKAMKQGFVYDETGSCDVKDMAGGDLVLCQPFFNFSRTVS